MVMRPLVVVGHQANAPAWCDLPLCLARSS
ncbi:Uncharacterised protein [Vibrio cholerae]|nr:Uncharacterised protein [Vibrio cholerae]